MQTGTIGVSGACSSRATVPRGLNVPEHARASARALGVDDRAAAARSDLAASWWIAFTALSRSLRSISAWPPFLSSAETDGRPARELHLRDVLREVREELPAEDRDVEHALVVRHDDVGRVRLDSRRLLDVDADAAEPERPDEGDLERAECVVVRPAADQACDADDRIEADQDGGEARAGRATFRPIFDRAQHGGHPTVRR